MAELGCELEKRKPEEEFWRWEGERVRRERGDIEVQEGNEENRTRKGINLLLAACFFLDVPMISQLGGGYCS